MANWVNVKEQNKFLNNTRVVIDLDYTTVIVFNIDGKYYAIDHLCTHADFSLEDAECEDSVITCPYHGAKFCVKSGQALSPPAFEDLETYETRVYNNTVQVLDKS